MSFPSKAINVNFNTASDSNTRTIRLNSGNLLVVTSCRDEERLEIKESDNRTLLEVRFTSSGPIVAIQGAVLELSATKEISLNARQINIHSQEQTIIHSQGDLELSSQENVEIRSPRDIRLKSKMIHLN